MSRNLVTNRPQGCWIHVDTFGYIDVKKMGKIFLIRNVLETAHTCFYDVFTRQDSVQHRDLSPGRILGRKQAYFTRQEN